MGEDLSRVKLSKKQRELLNDLEDLLIDLHLSPAFILDELDPDDLTLHLKWAKTYLVRGAVITQYTILDDMLGLIILQHQFGKQISRRSLMRSKRFTSFKFFILEKMAFNQKMDYVRDAHAIPKWVVADMYALNDLRNSLAHSYYVERRRRKPLWKDESVFQHGGYMRFQGDIGKIYDFFAETFFGGPLDEQEFTPTAHARKRKGIEVDMIAAIDAGKSTEQTGVSRADP